MQAVLATRYGAPEVLQLQEVAKPTPKDNEILIRLHATAVGASDIPMRKGEPFIARVFAGLTKPKDIPGDVLAGEVEAVGSAVTQFKPGDAVFGSCAPGSGTYAEYKTVPADGAVTKKPSNMTYAQTTYIPDGAMTALHFLRDTARIKSGQRVLVNGASGSVGSAGVQLAKYYETEVTGVCSTSNVERVKALGADAVIDYTQEDFTKSGQPYDIIFDAVAKSSFGACKDALTPNGVYLTTVPSLSTLPQVALTALMGGKKARFAAAGLSYNKANLEFLAELFEAGTLKPVIDRTYPLEDMVEAHRYVEAGHKKGTVVITIGEQS